MIEKIIVFIFGSLIGSFLNVCIFRLPRGLSVVRPRSFCVNCKQMIRWFDNIPFVSFLLLGGKCRNCKTKYSPRYFLIELLTAFSFLALYDKFGLDITFTINSVLVSCLIIATFVDIDFREIPDEVTLGGIGIGLLLNVFRSFFTANGYSYIIDSLSGLLAGGGIIYLTGLFGNFLFFKVLRKGNIDGETETMGGGDVKLLAMIGAFLGWKIAILVFFIAPFLGSVVGFYELLRKGKHTIPYGPALALASVICIFWAEKIVYWLFRISL